MNTFSKNASGRLESGARLRPCTTDVNCSSGSGSCLAPSAVAKTAGDAGGRSRATRRVSETAPYPFGDDRPTSPAFMRLLSQRSPRNSSHGDRSSFISAQLSARRRVSSPTVAARAWLRPAANSPAEAFLQTNSEVTADTSIPFPAQNTNKEQGCGSRTSTRAKLCESSSEQRCEADRCPLRRGKKELRRKKSGARKNGASLTPLECERQESSSNSSRPAPRVVMSPRQFPPPTFEKILLGLTDADFTTSGGETDVFGGSIVPSKPEVVERQREEPECIAMPVGLDTPGKEEASASVSPPSPVSQASLMEYRTDSHEDGVIPNHYLYIPPLRLEVLSEGKRPVPFLQQAAEDDAQISVRGDRRHIATLFSLEAAESQAQISRLQEQLKATRPFRLREVGDPSFPMNEGLQAPPGKSKRRHRSAVLETIVRQHDLQLQESGAEGNPRAPHGQQATGQVPRQTAELADNAAEPAALSSDGQLDYSGKDGSPPVSSGVASVDEDSPRQPTNKRADQDPAAFHSRPDGLGHPALAGVQEGCLEDQREDVPGAFDAVWGRCECPSQTYQEAPSYGTPSESGDCQQDCFVSDGVSERLNRMAEFLEAASLLPEQKEKRGSSLTAGPCNGIAADSRSNDFEENLKESTLVLGGEELATGSGGMAMLSLGDATQWEVRYSTVDSFPSSAEHSPINCKELNASDEDAGALQEGNDEEKRRDTDQEQGETGTLGSIGQGLTGPVPQEPPASAGSHWDASAGHTGPHRLSGSRLVSSDRSETTILPYGSFAEAVSDISRCVTKEPRVGAALHQRFLSLQSFQSGDTEDHIALERCDGVTPSDDRQSVSRKRQRTSTKQEKPVMCTLMPVLSVWRQEEWTGTAVNPDNESAVHTLTEDPTGSFCSTFRRIDLQQQGCLPAIADLAESPEPAAPTHTKMYVPLSFESGPQRHLPPGKLQLGEGSPQDEVSKEETAPPSEEVAGDDYEHQTSPSSSGSPCEAASLEPPRLKDNGQQCHGLPPTSGLSVGAIEAIDWATGGCAYGAGLHATLVGSVLLAICGLLTVFYMFDEGRGVRFFASCAVALSFVLALSLGLIQLAASLLKWRAVKCGIDSDVREALLFSLKCLSPAPDADGRSADASEESGQQLQLVCDYFVKTITRGSPCLDVSCTLKKRFGWTSFLAGLGGAGLVAVVQCSVQWQDKQSPFQIQTADVAAIGAALAYSVLLLVLSFWLASPPTRGAVKRAVGQHAAFQYLWTLTFVDFLVDKGAVTAKSVEDIRARFLDELPRRCPQYLMSLGTSFCGQEQRTTTVSVRGPRTFMSKFMTARIIWHLPNGTSLRALKNFHVGQRALLGFAAAPLRKEGPGEASAPAYLKLVWYCSGALPEELLIPIGFESIICNAEGKMQAWLVSALGKQAVPNVESAAAHRQPSEVMQFVLGLMQGEPTVSFLSSQIRRHVCEPASLSSASCEYSLFLRVPVRSIRRGLGSERGGAWFENNSSPFALRRAKKETADMGAAVRTHGKKAVTNESSGIVAGDGETSWTPQRPDLFAVSPNNPFSMQITTKEQWDTSAKAESNAVQLESNKTPGEFALLALMFASEEQREEFYGCLEEVLCA